MKNSAPADDMFIYTRHFHDGPVTGNPITSTRLQLSWPIGGTANHDVVSAALQRFGINESFDIGTCRMPGTPLYPFVAVDITEQQVWCLTEEDLMLLKAETGALSLRIVRSFAVPRIRFQVTPELVEKYMKRMPQMLPRQFQAARSVLIKSLEVCGDSITDEQIDGIFEMATEYLWPAALDKAITEHARHQP